LGCSGISWTICEQSAPRSRQTITSTPHHSLFYRPDALPDAKALKATSTGGNSTESILASIIKCIFTGFQKIPKKKIQGAFFGTAYKYTKMSHNIIRIYPAVHLRNDHSNYHKRYVLITNAAKLW